MKINESYNGFTDGVVNLKHGDDLHVGREDLTENYAIQDEIS